MISSVPFPRPATVLAGVLLSLQMGSAFAATPHEPPGFTPPPNLLQAMREAKAKSSQPVSPPSQIVLPTLGTASTAYRSPWVQEKEFGNSQPVSKSSGFQSQSFSSVGGQSALQGGTTMMLSTLPTAVGRIPATYDVSPTGAANYTIPLWTPPGARDIEPKLALVYSSDSPDSLMGPGWSLSGLSYITRCPKTLAQDGTLANVTLTTSDKFCLDGNKLRLTSGTYGSVSSTYQTELETFSKVTANGTSGGGPQWFEVKGKDGLIYEYGNTVDSRIAGVGNATPYLWALSKVKDRQGNNMTISYALSGGTFRPEVISYTQTPATSAAYNYTVVFGYDTRAGAVNLNGYVADASTQQTKVLTSIDMRHLGSTVRKYNIDYSTGSATGRPRVSAVQTCTTTDCLKPTVVTYQDGTAGIGSPSMSAGASATGGQMNTVDIDGDGRKDLVYAVTSGSNLLWYVKFATASGFGSAISTGLTTSTTDAVLFEDFLGEGRTSMLAPQSGVWYTVRWNGSAFALASTSSAVNSNNTPITGRCAVADLDGDGRADLVWINNTGAVYSQLNTSSATTVFFSSTATPSGLPLQTFAITGNNQYTSTPTRHIDVNGDGRDDIVGFIHEPGFGYFYAVLVSNGTTVSQIDASSALGATVIPLDFNNDRCTDTATNGYVTIRGCNGTSAQAVAFSGTLKAAADWDGDGRDDILVDSSGTFQVSLSQGDALGAASSTGISVGAGIYQIFDQDGDGLNDLAFVNSSAGYAVSYGLHNGAGVKPDLVLSMVDGYEMSVSFGYRPISDTTDTVTNPLCNYRDTPPPASARVFTGPMHVACKMTVTDGTGSTYTVTNTFYNPAYHLQGRGFLGFQRRYSIDSRDGILKMDNYGQTFPHIGMFAYQLVRQPGGSIYMRQLTNTFSSLSLGAGYETRSFPYVSQSVDDVYEVGGTLNSQWITRTTSTMTPDSYGNPANVTVTVTDKTSQLTSGGETFSTQTVNTITNDAANWCLGRPTQTQVTSTLPDMTSKTRTTSASVDYANCRITQEILEPSSTTLKVTTTYGFDTCGNVNSVDVVGKTPGGADMPTRTTASNYGTRCQLPESVTNSLTQTSTTAYDYGLGLPTSNTDANGIATSWVYDGYGRRTQENHPDGTHSQWGYYVCDSSNGYCGVADLRWYVANWEFTSSWSQIRYDYDCFDGFDRSRYKEAQNLTGGLDLLITTYNAFGRKEAQYNPFSATPAGLHWFAYDVVGRLVAENLYDASLALYRQTAYGYEGRKTTITEALGNTTAKYIDVRGNLRQVTDSSPGGTSYFAWDHFQNLLSSTDSTGAVSSASHNVRGFKTGSSDADAGAWTYSVNSLGEVVSQTDAKSQTTTFTYDDLSRLTSRTEAEGISTWVWGTSSVAKNIGKLASMSGTGYSESYSFDSIGRLSQTLSSADTTYQVDLGYDASTGFLDNITYPTSTSSYRLRAQYQYQFGILNQVRDYNAPSTIWWQLNAKDARGNPIDEQFGNGIHVISNNDDLTGHLNWRTSGNTGSYTNHQNITYEWDKNENLKKRIDVNQSNLTEEFFYDGLDRLYESKLNGTTNLTVALNAAGNITSKSDVGSFNYTTAQSGCSYYTHTQPHAVRNAGGVIYCYDQNGNMVKRNGATTSWYSYNLPNTISNGTVTSQFYYTPNRDRWKQVAGYGGGTETSIYIGGLMEKVSVSAGTAYRHYIPAGSNTIIHTRWSTGTNKTYYVTSDQVGSSTAVTDETGAVVVKESFSAYGARRNNTGWTGAPSSGDWTGIASATRQGFTGHEQLDNLNLVHMNGRVYDPVIGRFMSADPYIDWGAGSQGLNHYAYVGNKPLSFTDPTGFSELPGGYEITVSASRGSYPGFSSVPSGGYAPITSIGVGGGGAAPVDPNGATQGAAENVIVDMVVHGGARRGFSILRDFNQAGSFFLPGYTATLIGDQAFRDGRYLDAAAVYSQAMSEMAMAIATAGLGTAASTATRPAASATAKAGTTIFKTAHYASRLEKAGVNVARAEAAVTKEVAAMRGNMEVGASVWGRMRVDGVLVEYRAMPLPDGSVNIGSLFPVR